jgi:tetratricopeptide (TPR) repeat protein
MSEQEMSLIEKYFNNELDEAERLVVEQRMANDTAFRNEVALHQRTLNAIDLYAKDAFKKQLRERRPATNPGNNCKFYRIGIVAVLLLLALFFGWWRISTPSPQPQPQLMPPPAKDTAPIVDTPMVPGQPRAEKPSVPKSPDTRQLFAKYYRPYKPAEEDGAVHGGSTNPVATTTLTEVENNLRNGKYEDALLAFDQLPPKIKDNLNAIFLKASTLMALDRFSAAQPLFERVAAVPANIYSGEAKWYLALIALRQHDLPTAKNWLQLIQDDPGTAPNRRTDASNLWKKIK